MKHVSIIVRADWDVGAAVWVASSSDIEGLAVEADTFDALTAEIVAAITDLLELNGFPLNLPEIPIHIMAEQLVRVPNPAY